MPRILLVALLFSAALLRAQSAPPPITFNANFEGASIGKIEKLGDATFRVHVPGQYDERGRNRQTSWYAFRMDHVKGRDITLTLTDFVGEYNDTPGAVAMSREITPVWSADQRTWQPLPSMAWDDQKKEATLRFTPPADTIWIAHIPPYTTQHLRALLDDVDRSPLTLLEVIGHSVNGRPLHRITVTNSAIPDDQKRTVYLVARQHAWEAGTSWVMEGALRHAISDDPDVRQLRDRVIFRFLPMLDPDGVATGKVRFNANGYDVNRHWNRVDLRSKEHLRLMPEIWYAKKAIAADKSIALLVNMHNTETDEYLETLAADEPARSRIQRFSDALTEQTIFDPSRPITFSTSPTTTTNILYRELGVPVVLMELRVSTGKKLGRAPTVDDRLRFGRDLLRLLGKSGGLE